jgi:hypothetical protein
MGSSKISSNHYKLNEQLLLLHYGYPPLHTTGGIRMHKIKVHLQSYFSKIYTLSNQKKTVTYSQSLKDCRVTKFIIHLRHSFPTNLIFGKDHLLYFLSTLIKAHRLIKQKEINYLFTSYQPISDQLIGLILKKINPHIFWIADFRDPYPEEIKAKNILPQFQQIVLLWIQNHCDLITVVSEGLKKQFKSMGHKVFVLYNGLDKRPNSMKVPHLDSNFTGLIAYTGSLYSNLLNPQPFLRNLQHLFPKARFFYLGKDDASWKNWIPDGSPQSVASPIKSHKIAKKAQKKSNILLVFTWSNHQVQGILTTKLFEYLTAGKLVLVLIQGNKDPEWETVSKIFHNCILCYANECSVDQLYSKILEISNTAIKFNNPLISNYLWTKKISELMVKIHSITSR